MCGRARQSTAGLAAGLNEVLACLPSGPNPSLARLNMPPMEEASLESGDSSYSNSNRDNLHPGDAFGIFTLDRSSPHRSLPLDLRQAFDCVVAKWGVVPSGTKQNPLPTGSSKHFTSQCYNANTDAGLAPTFKRLYDSGKTTVVCLDGFYEWCDDVTIVGKGVPKQPYYIYRSQESSKHSITPLLVAGLYTDVSTGGDTPSTFKTFSLLTTQASADMRSIHVRMPVILTTPEDVLAWLQGPSGGDPNLVRRLAATTQRRCTKDDYGLASHTVTKAINKVTNFVENPHIFVAKEKVASIDNFFGKRPKGSEEDGGDGQSAAIFKSTTPPSIKKAKISSKSNFFKKAEHEESGDTKRNVVEKKVLSEGVGELIEDEAEPWSCPSCTFLNDAIAPVCGMCESESPATSHSQFSPAKQSSPAVVVSAAFKKTKVKSQIKALPKNKSIASFFKK